MDFDDFKRMQDKLHRERFAKFKDAFNEASKAQGGKAFDELFPGEEVQEERDPRADQVKEIVGELIASTTDEDPRDAVVRALVTYRSIVRHAQAGGTVLFHDADGKSKALKVRVKK